MVDKRESYTKEDLLASGRGELFGAKGPQLPAPNMLMMDRVVKMTETGGNFDKGYVEAELDINPICGSSDATLLAIRLCRDARPDAMWQLVGFYLGWLGGEGKGRALGVGEVKFTGGTADSEKVTYRIHFKRIVNRRLIMGTADGEVLVDGRLIYTASDLKVGLFEGYVCLLIIIRQSIKRRNLRNAEVSLKTESGHYYPVRHGFSPASQPL